MGCGWLGLPVASRLAESGFVVKGSTTTENKKDLLRHSGIRPYIFSFAPDLRGEIADFFTADILFLNTPFRRDLQDPFLYKQHIQNIIQCLVISPVKFVVFASSTSIYADHHGVMTEDQPLHPKDRRAQALWEAESLLRDNKHFDTTVLRFAGLYGKDRPIGGSLSGQKNIVYENVPVNLVHIEDGIEIVVRIIRKGLRRETFNVCGDEHPLRRDLYEVAAQRRGLPKPIFGKSAPKAPRIISNQKLKQALDYRFKFPDPLSMV